jgi:hypothetical protein
MKSIRHLIAAALLGASAMASATPIFAGQWNLYSNPYWMSDSGAGSRRAADDRNSRYRGLRQRGLV